MGIDGFSQPPSENSDFSILTLPFNHSHHPQQELSEGTKTVNNEQEKDDEEEEEEEEEKPKAEDVFVVCCGKKQDDPEWKLKCGRASASEFERWWNDSLATPMQADDRCIDKMYELLELYSGPRPQYEIVKKAMPPMPSVNSPPSEEERFENAFAYLTTYGIAIAITLVFKFLF